MANFTYITEPSSKLSTSDDNGRGKKQVEHTSHLPLECLSNEKGFLKNANLVWSHFLTKKRENAGNIRESR